MRKIFMTMAALLTMLAGTAVFSAAQYRGDYDRDDGYYSRDYGYRGNYDYREGMRAAREFGYRDGMQVAREDAWRGKPFNPNPRGRFDDADHGYRHEFGSRHEYREEYSEAYRAGYQRAFRWRGYGYGYGYGY
jgi:hypothetical protein